MYHLQLHAHLAEVVRDRYLQILAISRWSPTR